MAWAFSLGLPIAVLDRNQLQRVDADEIFVRPQQEESEECRPKRNDCNIVDDRGARTWCLGRASLHGDAIVNRVGKEAAEQDD